MIECNASGGERLLNRWVSSLVRSSRVRSGVILAAAVISTVAADAKVIYVNSATATTGNGTSWGKAFIYLRDALDDAVAGDSVYLAKGTYYPDQEAIPTDVNQRVIVGDRELSFVLDRVAIYGGFVGNETAINQRDPEANPTILSGEIFKVTPTTQGFERYWSLHVAVLKGNSTLDGVIVKNGRANGDENPANQGGGVLVPSGFSLKLVSSVVQDNLAAESGGGISGSVTATDCTFSGNVVNNEFLSVANKAKHFWLFSPACNGGAISGDVTARNCQFLGNQVKTHSLDIGITTTATGGAISGATIVLDTCSFTANTATSVSVGPNSDATSRGGAVSTTGSVTASNCTYSQNRSDASSYASLSPPKTPPVYVFNASPTCFGGAIAGQVNLANCSFDANESNSQALSGDYGTCTSHGGAVYAEGASQIVNCTFTKNNSIGDIVAVAPPNFFSRFGGAVYAATTALPLSNSTFLDNGTSGLASALCCNGNVNILNNIFWYTVDTLGGLDLDFPIHVTGKARISNRLYPSPTTETINILKGGIDNITDTPGANVDFGEPPERTLLVADPMFVDVANPIGPDGTWRTADDGLRLTVGSPAIGIGRSQFLPLDNFDLDQDGNIAEITPVDNAGFARVQDGFLDLGAYELGDLVTAPDISVERPAGNVLVDGVSSVDFSAFPRIPTAFVIRNTGTSDLRNLVVTGTGVDIDSFKFTQPAATSLAPGATTTLAVTFTPIAVGPRTAQLHISSNDPNESPFDIDLLGNAPVPDIAVEYPNGIDLTDGSSIVNYGAIGAKSSSSKTFTIRNSGAANLDLLNISSAGPNAANFTVSAAGLTLLTPGASTTFNVVFRPSGTGVRNASINIQSSDPDTESSFVVKVTGSGFAAPEIAVSEAFSPELVNGGTNDFGSVQIGLLHSKTFIVKNLGSGVLKNIVISRSGSSNFSLTKIGVTTLNPGSQAKFTVTFKPTATGKKIGKLVIASNDADEGSINITLTGTGIAKATAASSFNLAAAPKPFAITPVVSSTNRGVVTVTKSSDGSKHLVLTVDKSATRRRTVEVSSNLMEWFSGSDYTTTLLDNNSILRVRDLTPVKQGEKRYIRLK